MSDACEAFLLCAAELSAVVRIASTPCREKPIEACRGGKHA
ncbi:hypothetical protein HMPREF0762_00697 [Slackia exigua ATCC 700122]|uniref:Uncharacterized protein n=1 Tax=Slackia exigua (strain ATCC 700122 / DSM 15923 / CIP 105133 / JCM 11022 / KCTC 5966 / S-7) TaxID=649764 RepID=D0WFU7_SLAES|nr:hypothetical protein HMPREF0762_00697 [Slackia exigua ATCC 700122]